MAPTQVAVSESAAACQAPLRLTAQNGERSTVPVTIPALPEAKVGTVPVAKLYCFANPARRAIYITIDDGWTPSNEVLDLMHHSYLPITAFLITKAAAEHLSNWKDFLAAGGTIGDHTVSHPYLTKLSLAKATAQWAQARTSLGHWLGQTPVMGRPPYGAFNHTVEVAAARAGLTSLAGWERHHVGQPHPDLERQAARPGRDRHPALGSRPGPSAHRPAGQRSGPCT